ncbi:hypothetical protein MKX01_035620, partial [Papaver californicum]
PFLLYSFFIPNFFVSQWDQFAKKHYQRQLLQLAASYGDASSSSTGLLFSFEKSEKIKAIEPQGPRLYYGDDYNSEMNMHENFYYKTLQKTSLSFPPIPDLDAIVGSCNGLICLNKYHHGIPDPIHICNPNTGEYVNLPEYTLREERCEFAFGFGYVHSVTNDQYKVVRIYYPDDYDKGQVQVYTIGSGSGWRTIGETSYLLFMPSPLGTFVNGALHWIDDQNKKIVAFNLADEEFRLIQPPPCYDAMDTCFNILQAVRGNLCFCHQRNEEHLLDIWTPKKNATEASWSRDFSRAYDSAKEMDRDEFPVIPLFITDKNEFLFVHQGSTLYCYDPKSTTVINLWDHEKWKSMGLMTFPELWDDEKWDLVGLTAFPHMKFH